MNVVALPMHTDAELEGVIVTADGVAFTLIVAVVGVPQPFIKLTVVVPSETPVITPVVLPAVAIEVLDVDQVPPVALLESVVVPPIPQTSKDPDIVPGAPFIVTMRMDAGAHPFEYVIVDVPADTPVTIPVADPTVATPVAELLHVPPVVALANVVVPLIHVEAVPVIAAGAATTVTIRLAADPQPVAYNIVTVPAPTPVTNPVPVSADAIDVFPLVQLPPVTEFDNVIVLPSQTEEGPDIVAGAAFTVTTLVAGVPHPLSYVMVAVP